MIFSENWQSGAPFRSEYMMFCIRFFTLIKVTFTAAGLEKTEVVIRVHIHWGIMVKLNTLSCKSVTGRSVSLYFPDVFEPEI